MRHAAAEDGTAVGPGLAAHTKQCSTKHNHWSWHSVQLPVLTRLLLAQSWHHLGLGLPASAGT